MLAHLPRCRRARAPPADADAPAVEERAGVAAGGGDVRRQLPEARRNEVALPHALDARRARRGADDARRDAVRRRERRGVVRATRRGEQRAQRHGGGGRLVVGAPREDDGGAVRRDRLGDADDLSV